MRQRIRQINKIGKGKYYTNSMTIGESLIFVFLKFTILLPFYLLYWAIKYSYLGIKKLVENNKRDDE